LQDIAFNEFESGFVGVAYSQCFREFSVEFHGDQPSQCGVECRSARPARSDLDDRGDGISRVLAARCARDALQNGVVEKEMLP